MTARQGLAARDVELAEVEARYHPEVQAGLDVLAKRAEASADPFSANDVRAALIDAGVPGPARGQVFRVAVQAGILRRLDQWETSTDPGTHGKPLPRYVRAGLPVAHRAEVVGVPVTRTAGGRFAPAVEVMPGQVDIFEAIAEASS